MISITEMEAMLDELAAEFPLELYRKLNGGIILLPEAKRHQNDKANNLYVMGEYHRDRNLGRFIAIYYGSFAQTARHLSREQLREKLMGTLKHEFRHHIESLAGERDLEIADARYIAEYLKKIRPQEIK